MKNKLIFLLIALCSMSFVQGAYSGDIKDDNNEKRPYYFGPFLGYGTTTWRHLIPKEDNFAGTPVTVQEGGFAGGFFFGYEFSKSFAVEGLYVHFPPAYLTLDQPYSQPPDIDEKTGKNYGGDGIRNLTTKTQAYAVYGKFMVPIPKTHVRGFALAGVEVTLRDDILAKTKRVVGPIFGAGLNYEFNNRWTAELGFNYYAGDAQAKTRVVDNFMPFLYTAHMKFAYHF
jgi:hypothetical protein